MSSALTNIGTPPNSRVNDLLIELLVLTGKLPYLHHGGQGLYTTRGSDLLHNALLRTHYVVYLYVTCWVPLGSRRDIWRKVGFRTYKGVGVSLRLIYNMLGFTPSILRFYNSRWDVTFLQSYFCSFTKTAVLMFLGQTKTRLIINVICMFKVSLKRTIIRDTLCTIKVIRVVVF